MPTVAPFSGSSCFIIALVNQIIELTKTLGECLPIKDSNVLHEVQDTLLNNFRFGRRNYTIFQVGKATLLRVSDVMRLKQADIFNLDGSIKQNAFIHDRKTGKPNTLYLFKQSSYCTVNVYLIISWILNGSFLSYQTTPGILSRRFFNVMVFSGRKVALL